MKQEPRYNFSLKVLPTSMSLTSVLVITSRAAIIHQLVPPLEVLKIENRSVIELLKELFENFWDDYDNR